MKLSRMLRRLKQMMKNNTVQYFIVPYFEVVNYVNINKAYFCYFREIFKFRGINQKLIIQELRTTLFSKLLAHF